MGNHIYGLVKQQWWRLENHPMLIKIAVKSFENNTYSLLKENCDNIWKSISTTFWENHIHFLLKGMWKINSAAWRVETTFRKPHPLFIDRAVIPCKKPNQKQWRNLENNINCLTKVPWLHVKKPCPLLRETAVTTCGKQDPLPIKCAATVKVIKTWAA